MRARRPSKSRRADDAREAEVGDLGDTPVTEQYVRGLDVAVDHGTSMQERERGTYVRGDAPKGFS